MKINDKDISIEELVDELKPSTDFKEYCGNGIYLSKQDQEILKRYNFQYEKYSNIKSLIFDIEEYLNDNSGQMEDLENVASYLSEFNYYHNTNK